MLGRSFVKAMRGPSLSLSARLRVPSTYAPSISSLAKLAPRMSRPSVLPTLGHPLSLRMPLQTQTLSIRLLSSPAPPFTAQAPFPSEQPMTAAGGETNEQLDEAVSKLKAQNITSDSMFLPLLSLALTLCASYMMYYVTKDALERPIPEHAMRPGDYLAQQRREAKRRQTEQQQQQKQQQQSELDQHNATASPAQSSLWPFQKGGTTPSPSSRATAAVTPPTTTSKSAASSKNGDEDGGGKSDHHSKHDGIIVPEKYSDLRVFSGRTNVPLAREIVNILGVPLGKVSIRYSEAGELGIQVNENVRGKDVYVIQPTAPPNINDSIMELVLLISTMRRASARTITAVIPYYGYARQDRKMQSRVPIASADVARVLEAVGVDRVVAVDLHGGQIQGFFSPTVPCDNLESSPVALDYFADLGLKSESTVIVSPDAGGVNRAKTFRDAFKSKGVDAGLAMVIKQRMRSNESTRTELVGNVKDCDVIIVDDMIDTARTVTRAANELRERGAKRIYCFATHGLFSGDAIDRIRGSAIDRLIVTNTLTIPPHKQIDKIDQLSVAAMLAAAIDRVHTNQSLSSIFKPDMLHKIHPHSAPKHNQLTSPRES